MDTKRREDNEMESKIVLRKEIDMDRMVEAVQPCVLEQITNAVRSMTTNAEASGVRSASAGLPSYASAQKTEE